MRSVDNSSRQIKEITEFPTMGVSWKELQTPQSATVKKQAGSSEESGQVSDDVGEEAYDSSYDGKFAKGEKKRKKDDDNAASSGHYKDNGDGPRRKKREKRSRSRSFD